MKRYIVRILLKLALGQISVYRSDDISLLCVVSGSSLREALISSRSASCSPAMVPLTSFYFFLRKRHGRWVEKERVCAGDFILAWNLTWSQERLSSSGHYRERLNRWQSSEFHIDTWRLQRHSWLSTTRSSTTLSAEGNTNKVIYYTVTGKYTQGHLLHCHQGVVHKVNYCHQDTLHSRSLLHCHFWQLDQFLLSFFNWNIGSHSEERGGKYLLLWVQRARASLPLEEESLRHRLKNKANVRTSKWPDHCDRTSHVVQTLCCCLQSPGRKMLLLRKNPNPCHEIAWPRDSWALHIDTRKFHRVRAPYIQGHLLHWRQLD